MKKLLLSTLFLVTTYCLHAQCKYQIENYDKFNESYLIQTNFKYLKGSTLDLAGPTTEVALQKAYNKKDTVYFLILSDVSRYESLDDGLPQRSVKKDQDLILLFENGNKVTLKSVQDVNEKKTSEERLGVKKEHTHILKAAYLIKKDQFEALSASRLKDLRIMMTDAANNVSSKDVEVKDKSGAVLTELVACIKPKLFSKK